MSQNTNLQERYAKIVDAKLRAEVIVDGLFNHRAEGNPKAGAVKIPYRTEATVGDYSIANGGSLANPATSYINLVCDKDYYVNELIDGFVAEAVPDGLVAERLDSAGYQLALKKDTELVNLLIADGTKTTTDTTAVTASTIYDKIVDEVTAARHAKVPKKNMWILVPTNMYGLLLKCDDFIATAASAKEWGNGQIGELAGVPVYETANLDSKTVTISGTTYDVEFIVGNNVWCHSVNEWMVNPGINDLKDGIHIGASAVQGRKVGGSIISQTGTVIVKIAAQAE